MAPEPDERDAEEEGKGSQMLSKTRQARAETYRSETLTRIAEMTEEARRRRSPRDRDQGPQTER